MLMAEKKQEESKSEIKPDLSWNHLEEIRGIKNEKSCKQKKNNN